MRHLCIVLHGIEYDPATVSWVEDFVIDLQHKTKVELFPEVYGYVSGKRVWMWPGWRNELVAREVKALKRIQVRLLEWDRNAKFSILAHSLGGTIVEACLKDNMKLHNIILMQAATDENLNWKEYEKNFNKVFVYWSPNDEDLPWSYWGKMGLVGPQVHHPRVQSLKRQWTNDKFMDYSTLGGVDQDKLIKQIEA